MSIEVETQDCSALSEEDLADMAAMGGSFDIDRLTSAKDDWVLCTRAADTGRLHGFAFLTLERIGGTPCVLIGLMSVKRTSRRDAVLKGLMTEAFHRALMAFPDEDVVVGSRFVSADGLEAFRDLTELIPRPGHRAVGEERAWGRRLARRFGVDSAYDEKTFLVSKKARGGFVDHESTKPGKAGTDVLALFDGINHAAGGAIIIHGWTMAEDLLTLGGR